MHDTTYQYFTRSFILLLFSLFFLHDFSLGSEKNVDIVMTTIFGDIDIEIYLEKAPITSKNFLKYVDGGHFNDGSFYRTVTYENDKGSPKIEVIQGGLGQNISLFPPIDHETTQTSGVKHLDGVISMGRGEIGTAASEFFICIGDQPGLDFGQSRNADKQGFSAFGRVVSGMEVVRKIHQQSSNRPADNPYVEGQMIDNPVVIKNVRRN